MSDLLAQCKEILEGASYEELLSDNKINLIIQLPNSATAHRRIIIEPQKNLLLIYSEDSNLKVSSEPNKRKSLEFIAKANELLNFGNIELNYDTGEFRIKTSQALPGVQDARPIIRYMLEVQEYSFQALVSAVKQLNSTEGESPFDIANKLFKAFHTGNL